MAPNSKPAKAPKKSTSPSKAPKDAAPVPGPSKPTKSKPEKVSEPDSNENEEQDDGGDSADSENDDGDSENGGVNEEGMERLMKALGDDGLDDYEQMQLHAVLGGDEDEDDEEDSSFTLENAADAADDNGGSESEDGSDAGEDGEEDEDEGEDSEEEEDVALDDVESIDDDAVPRQKIEIDNTVALARIRETIQLDASLPWTETLVLSYPDSIDVDVNDDLNRELAFYKQALHGANAARDLAAKHKFPFTRPADYFAEMVKTDAHMERIRQRLLDERAGIKKSEDKRKEREGKKFGKQVQIEKLKERERGKKEMEERLKGLKRKRGDMLDKPSGDDDGFDIAVEDAISDRPAKRGRGAAPSGRGGPKIPRQARDKKYGFGGAGKYSKSNTRESTDDFGGSSRGGRGGARGGRGGSRGGFGRGGGRGGGAKRLGKGRRETARTKR